MADDQPSPGFELRRTPPPYPVGTRVRVFVTVTQAVLAGAGGTVKRLTEDGLVWVELDERSPVAGAHLFDESHDGARYVLAGPENLGKATR